MLTVEVTQFLRQYWLQKGLNINDITVFCQRFAAWKAAGVAGEDDFYEFGKDGAYISPLVNDEPYILRHVHLVPLRSSELNKWDICWQQYKRRTSDRFLIYVEDQQRFLLIAILDEPTAHEISRMKTSQDKALMTWFAEIADKFIYHHEIIA